MTADAPPRPVWISVEVAALNVATSDGGHPAWEIEEGWPGRVETTNGRPSGAGFLWVAIEKTRGGGARVILCAPSWLKAFFGPSYLNVTDAVAVAQRFLTASVARPGDLDRDKMGEMFQQFKRL